MTDVELLTPPRVQAERPVSPVVASEVEQPLIGGHKTCADVTAQICAPLERRPTRMWWMAFAVALAALGIGAVCVAYQVATGIGTWA